MQTYLEVKYGSQAVKINPVLGYSSVENIRLNGLLDQRDMRIHHPGIKIPREADHFPAPWYHFTYHDFHHAIVVSAIPPAFRRLYIKIADIGKLLSETHTNSNATSIYLKSRCEVLSDKNIDMEKPDWQPVLKRSSDELTFWYSLRFTLSAFEMMLYSDSKPILSKIVQKLKKSQLFKEDPRQASAKLQSPKEGPIYVPISLIN